MKQVPITLAVTAAIIFWAPELAEAHHGWASFDTRTVLTLKGTVTDFHFVNPHSIVEFEVKDDKGQVRVWQGELTSPGHLAPRGWTRNSLESGSEVSVTGYPAKNNVPSLWVTKIFANGQELKIEGGN